MSQGRTIMITRRRLVQVSSASVLAAGFAPVVVRRAHAQTWPNRFVRLVVPFPPGGGPDAIARVVAARISEIWGQQLVVENRSGGASNIGHEAVARAEPDGYTLFLASVALAANRFLFPSLNYDPVADLAPISLICDYPNVMV